jgi:hypothetical protein
MNPMVQVLLARKIGISLSDLEAMLSRFHELATHIRPNMSVDELRDASARFSLTTAEADHLYHQLTSPHAGQAEQLYKLAAALPVSDATIEHLVLWSTTATYASTIAFVTKCANLRRETPGIREGDIAAFVAHRLKHQVSDGAMRLEAQRMANLRQTPGFTEEEQEMINRYHARVGPDMTVYR